MIKEKKIVHLFPLIIIIAIFALKFWAQQDCIEYVGNFTENFNTVEYKDVQNSSVANWPSGPITLGSLGANFQIAAPAGMGAEIYVCDASDFDGDGYPDLIGLDITDTDNPRLILIRNHFEDLNADGVDDDGIIFLIDTNEVYDDGLVCDPASITVGDYNNDGLSDFFFLKNEEDEFGYTGFLAVMYINVGTAEDPDFYRYNEFPNLDFTSRFMDAGIYCNWSADHLGSMDIDNDGDVDILVISEDKIFLVRNPGTENFDLNNFGIAEVNYDQRTGFTEEAVGGDYTYRGGSSIDAADFDNDGDIDIIGGTVNDIGYLVYYENDGTGNFTRKEILIPNPDCTGTVATCVADFDHDGRLDIVGANDAWNAGNEARMWLMENKGAQLDFEFKCQNNCEPILPDPHDVDMSALLDYDQDGDIDVILADANHSGDYYLIINELAPVYTTYGEACSTNLTPELDPTLNAITRAKMTNLRQGVLGGSSEGLRVEYYVTNNGKDWEFYASFEGDDIHNYTDLPDHSFNHYGSRLKWKAILSAPEDPMAEYTGASFETPFIDEIQFEYVHVDQREYSRTSVVVTTVLDENDQEVRLIIGSTFYFPTWQGHLRAYDVSLMAPENTSYSALRTVSRPDLSAPSGREIIPEEVEILWDAGELLDSRTSSDRTIYTAIPVDSVLTRIDFTDTNVATLGPILQDVNNQNEGLINFVRGEGRYWKLGDSNHSNPIVVVPPDGVPDKMGSGYQDFRDTWESRREVLYVGANDGMLHCFDVLTGEELWGFIPYNLVPKLKNMWAVDQATGERYFLRDVYVDGSPVASDVNIDKDGDGSEEWITILICGQGPGQGSTIGGGTNYYFALDITDPANPQPLWEFTHERLGETWAVPAIGKIFKGGEDTWVAFMGSGYDNNLGEEAGNLFYAVDLEDGNTFWNFEAADIDTSGNFPNIVNAIPGSSSLIDINQDGYADRVYVGDLDGRVWKVDVSIGYQGPDSWDEEIIYEDSNNYPIISRPAAWINPSGGGTVPHLYFGTGGDDQAPADASYSFVALLDGNTPEVEWYLGDPAVLNLPEEKNWGDLGVGQKVWADPEVADYIVYFSTVTGSIESVDPCQSLSGAGKLYARYIQAVGGTAIGGTAFKTASGPAESLELAIKTRSAVTISERQRTQEKIRKREVYIQEYDSTIQKLEQPVGALLKIKSWREIYRVIR